MRGCLSLSLLRSNTNKKRSQQPVLLDLVRSDTLLDNFLSLLSRRLITFCFRVSLSLYFSGNFDLLEDSVDGSMVTATLTKLMGKDGKETRRVWTSETEDSEDTFSITVDAVGKYAFCIALDPSMDDYAEDYEDSYPVGFNLRCDPLPRSLPPDESGPEAQRGMRLIETASYIESDWRNLLDHFDYLRSREQVYAQLTSQTADRLMGWNIVEALLVVTMAFCQVVYWKKFFETRRYL